MGEDDLSRRRHAPAERGTLITQKCHLEPFTRRKAPADSKEILAGIPKGFGFVPNMLGVMAEAPALLRAYRTLSGIFEQTSLSTGVEPLARSNFPYSFRFSEVFHPLPQRGVADHGTELSAALIAVDTPH